MAVRDILLYPNPALKRRSRAVEPAEAPAVAADLVDTMRAHAGAVGLAAPQLGEHPKAASSQGLLVLANPRVLRERRREVAREGCLSVPHLTANVRRATRIELEAHAPAGARLELTSEGFEARCLLHEIDHLDGILFLDRVDSLATDVFRRKSYR